MKDISNTIFLSPSAFLLAGRSDTEDLVPCSVTTLPLPSASPLTTLGVACADGCSFHTPFRPPLKELRRVLGGNKAEQAFLRKEGRGMGSKTRRVEWKEGRGREEQTLRYPERTGSGDLIRNGMAGNTNTGTRSLANCGCFRSFSLPRLRCEERRISLQSFLDTFVRTISSGGFGSVVELMENSTQEHYAGKMIPCMTAKDEERIDREVNRLRKFTHLGIVGLKEVASMDNMKVIVMELGGHSLADIVRDHTSRGVLVARDVVYRVMVDTSSALNLMHNDSSGATAHGDVKMENILLFPGGHFKLCDLGAAESEDVNSSHGVMSQLYVSPERMESETGKATCSSDVWALGIVLHWLLFGEPPFKSQNAARLFREIGSFRVSMIGSSCGGEERALLMRMLDPNPETRETSRQLCSFGVFRCLVNTPSGVWKLKDADDQENSDKLKNAARLETEQALTG
ncbi:putative CAMK family protein kinase [Blattamonas nauphoetae]|uniref:CAMK family protein kinase n=1 Tax=Blattamonas nauphoetae TaxID=2049346 RepID=A0ABQ9XSU1_9EUKA|nr:putative CAMK family protein kinase [Blattamonas nauphoetae]